MNVIVQHGYDVISFLISMKTSIMQDQPTDDLCSVCVVCIVTEGCHKCPCAAQIRCYFSFDFHENIHHAGSTD